jgi:transcription initiation factor TFIID subunit 5
LQNELLRLLWPIFVYSYLELVGNGYSQDAYYFLKEYGPTFKNHHADELHEFETVTLPQHVLDNPTAKLYKGTKYRLPLNNHVYYTLLTFLETNAKVGGTVLIYLLQTYCEIRETTRGPIDQYSFEAIINQARGTDEEPDLEEGILGAFTGVTNKDIMDNNAVLKLGMMPMDPELAQDVRTELEDEDIKHPPELGKPSLVEEFDRTIKREDTPDAPSKNEIPMPPTRARDVIMEVQKIKENRDRFKIEGRTGGVGPAISVCMFTFHNTLDA